MFMYCINTKCIKKEGGVLAQWLKLKIARHDEKVADPCYKLLIKILKSHINLCKMGIRWPPLKYGNAATISLMCVQSESLNHSLRDF